MDVKMANCPFCGEEFKEKGLHAHTRQCKANPDNNPPAPVFEADEEQHDPGILPPEPPEIDMSVTDEGQPSIGEPVVAAVAADESSREGVVRVQPELVPAKEHPEAKNYTNKFTDKVRCPHCAEAFRPFRKIGAGLLSCLGCGTVFADVVMRNSWRNDVNEIEFKRPVA